MTTLYWHAYILVKRWVCAVLGHVFEFWISRGYGIAQCQRCQQSYTTTERAAQQ